jgi:hypothetical protein
MNVTNYEVNGARLAEMQSRGIVIRSARDAADLIGQLLQSGVKRLILHEKNVCPEMWQVSNGLAVSILSEFKNSGVIVAFVGEFDLHKSKSLQAIIRESNLGKNVSFMDNIETAKKRLSEL